MKIISSIFFVTAIFMVRPVAAQTNVTLPVKEWKTAQEEVFIFYICGDGGLNNFSKVMCKQLNDAGYDVAALDAKAYFWERKTPEQSAVDIAGYIHTHAVNKKIVMVGYSFGANVMPFIVNRLPVDIKRRVGNVLLISPSGTTDFEIHWLDILGINRKRNMNVANEINRMGYINTALIFGEDETYPLLEKQVKADTLIKISGGHHFDYNAARLADCLVGIVRNKSY